jgi:DNA-binding winged helix-turn-helix (wHTH) protein
MVRQFGRYQLDLASLELRRDGAIVHLSPSAFGVLKLLIEHAPAAVSKEDLLAAVGAEASVSDASLTNVIDEIRAAIGDQARPAELLRTLHGFGYAFAADALEDTAAVGIEQLPLCQLVLGSRRFTLPAGSHLVGRDAAAAVFINHQSVSRRHARIVVTAEHALVEDLQSRNGTFVNGKRVDGPTEMRHGDVLGLGLVTLILEKASAGSTRTDGDWVVRPA